MSVPHTAIPIRPSPASPESMTIAPSRGLPRRVREVLLLALTIYMGAGNAVTAGGNRGLALGNPVTVLPRYRNDALTWNAAILCRAGEGVPDLCAVTHRFGTK